MSFGDRLHAAFAARGRTCVGIDPHPSLLRDWGLGDDVAGLERFARSAAETLGALAPVVKPQSAFFERHGSAGVAVLAATIADLRAAGALVLLDVKRGDIGSTSAAYADGYLDPGSDLAADAVTLNPFLGPGSLDPFVAAAREHARGLFVLAATSNPEGPVVQHARTRDGRSVAAVVLDWLRDLNRSAPTTGPLGSFGAVVGAGVTLPDDADLAIGGPLLLPGVGAQGGDVDAVRRLAGGRGAVAAAMLPATSRAVLAAGPDPAALAAACRAALAEAAVLGEP